MKFKISGDIKKVIFDYDGVIVETDEYNYRVFNKLFKRYNIEFNKKIYKRYFMGRGLKETMSDFFKNKINNEEIMTLIDEKKRMFDEKYEEEVSIFPDAKILLQKLFNKIPMCVVSGTRKNLLEASFKKFDLHKFFEFYLTSEDFLKGKPNQEPFLIASKKFGISPSEILVIEDSLNGILAAKKATMMCIAVTHTNTKKELMKADFIVDSLEDIVI